MVDGGPGSDTADYAAHPHGIVADLATGRVTPLPRLLAFGDSITHGVVAPDDTERGGYRTVLWQKLEQAGLAADFRGSLANGPTALPDRQHEGLRGATIADLDASDTVRLGLADPDIILLMIGTNDTGTSGASRMLADLRALLLSITATRPSTLLLVSGIPPIIDAGRNVRALDCNAGIPALVAELAPTRRIGFVEMGHLTHADLTGLPADGTGLHPNDAGYAKIAERWFDALLAAGAYTVIHDPLVAVTHVVGSGRNDRLLGNAADNRLEGGDGDDLLSGHGGDDLLLGGAGADTIGGDGGFDRAVLTGRRSAYSIVAVGETLVVSGPDGTDRIEGVERLEFDDRRVVGAKPDWQPRGDSLTLTSGAARIAVRQQPIAPVTDPTRGVLDTKVTLDGRDPGGTAATLKQGWLLATTADIDANGLGEVFFMAMDPVDGLGQGFGATWELAATGAVVRWQTHLQLRRDGWEVAGAAGINDRPGDDILWQHTTSGIKAFWSDTDRDGRLDLGSSIPGLPSSSVERLVGTADLDGDGRRELLIHNDANGAVTAWFLHDDGSGLVSATHRRDFVDFAALTATPGPASDLRLFSLPSLF